MDPRLVVAPDGMSASLLLPAGSSLRPEALEAVLRGAGVIHGLQAPAALAAGREAAIDRTLIIARGDPPTPGLDGWVEPCLHEPESVYGEGQVDLRELHHFREIHAGEPVLRRIRATSGIPGRTVTGNVLEPPEVREADLEGCCGPGVAPDPDDGDRAVAERSGIYQRFSRVGRLSLQVSDRVEVPGDVDLTIGHIDTHFPIVVRGDIRLGFRVKTAASLEVEGSIEDSRVTAQGDLIVKAGILVGRERVKAHGDLRARHIQARPIRARNVTADMGIVGAEVTARGQVQAREIMGGTVTAAAGVVCDVLGSPDGTPTCITVGVDPFEAGLHAWATAALPDLEVALVQERERGRCLGHRIQTLLSAGEDHAAEDAALRASAAHVHVLVADISRARDAIAHHAERLIKARALERIAVVEVRRQCYPPLTIVIGDHRLVVNEPLGRVRFAWREDGIAVS